MSDKVKDKVWMFHHYATPPSIIGLTRPYDLSIQLQKKDYSCTIFSSSFLHYAGYNLIKNKKRYVEKIENGVKFKFIKTDDYVNSGLKRIKNMFCYYINLFRISKKEYSSEGKPKVIIASSPHLLTLVAGIKIAKKMGVPCIVEVRDLWPESIVAYKGISKRNPIIWSLYKVEKWIYKKADNIIFTIEGGKEYIIDKKWDREIDVSKIRYLNNGVDLESFNYNKEHYQLEDEDLDNPESFNVIYTGSVRTVNNLGIVIDAAKYLQENNEENIKFLVFGDGNEKEKLQQRCKEENIKNIVFKGYVEKKHIPNILSKSNLNILNYTKHDIWKYGGSQNKMFEYLASGKPVLSTIKMGYDIIEKYNAGISLEEQTQESIGKAILSIARLNKEEYEEMSRNALKAAKDYDFNVLAEKLIDIIENV